MLVNAAPKDAIIALRDVHLTLGSLAGDVNILRGIDLTVYPGEILSVVGPSGSGKTSMLMIVAGLEQATDGDVRIGGENFRTLGEDGLARFRRDNLGIVFQNFHLVPTMTAAENVAIPLELAGRHDAADRAAAVLDQVGLGHRLSHYPGQLSGGEQQRVALARAFASEPALILADEPTGNLDEHTGEQIIALMFDLARTQKTTLMLITHDPALARACDRTVEMRDGRIVTAEPPKIAAPKTAAPKIVTPKIVTPEVAVSEVAVPEVAIVQAATPKAGE